MNLYKSRLYLSLFSRVKDSLCRRGYCRIQTNYKGLPLITRKRPYSINYVNPNAYYNSSVPLFQLGLVRFTWPIRILIDW